MSYKILLADDSVTVQKIVTLTFSDEGVDVVPVNNGDEAIRRLQSLRPALVMADVSIPGKNGYEICAFVKNHPELKKTPVILLVPAFEPFDEERAAQVKADHHLTKPFQSIRTLIATVKSLIENEQRATTEPLELDWPSTESQEPASLPPLEVERQTAALTSLPLMQDDADVLSATEPDTGELAQPKLATGALEWPAPLNPNDERSTADLKNDISEISAIGSAAMVIGTSPASVGSMWDDDVLELDDVLPPIAPMVLLPPQPPPPVSVINATTNTGNTGNAGNTGNTGAITQSVRMTSVEAVTTIPANIIDEIVNRVAAQVTQQISQQLAQQFSQFAARVSQDVIAQLAAAQTQAVRVPASPPKRDNGDTLLDL